LRIVDTVVARDLDSFAVSEPVLAMELIPAIRRQLARAGRRGSGAVVSGRRAALWRAQQHAARIDNSVEDLRRYCLESLRPRRFLEEDDYLRGYRDGFQAVLREIRRIEGEAEGQARRPGS
jgi:hypothetical protein